MTHSVKIVEPGREVTFTSDVPALAVAMAREWAGLPVNKPIEPVYRSPLDGALLGDSRGGTLKPPTQGVIAQGFEAYGGMGERR